MNQIVAHEAQSDTMAIMAIIEKVALNPDVDIAKMQQIMDMQERILDRNAQQFFTSALAAMQSELPSVIEGSAGHNSKYAKLESIVKEVRPTLHKFGFAVTFRIHQEAQMLNVKAILSHKDGHCESTSMSLPADTSGSKNAVQALGSTTSYGKRYTFCALLNITTHGEDMDGNRAGALISSTQAGIVTEKLMQCSADARESFAKSYPKSSDVPKVDFDKVVTKLNRSIAEHNAKNEGE